MDRYTESSHESRRIVIPGCLCISKGLQNGIRLHNLVFQGGLFRHFLLLFASTDESKVRDDLLGIFGLAGAGLSSESVKNPSLTFFIV